MATLKLLHILSVFIWVGSLLTLSRTLLFKDAIVNRTTPLLKNLYLKVDLPAMACSVTLGLLSLILNKVEFKPWLHMKLTFVFLLILYDLYIGHTLFKKKKRGVGFRILHGVACLCFVAVLASIYLVKARV